ncbi:tautomerase family protein [bacterium]|nr:tautomerase family protein [candidate division CSSED10-310 bacterium]
MPVITVEGGHIADLAKKRKFVEKLTDAAMDAYGLPREVFVVLLKANSPDNVGVGGELLIDRHRNVD